MLDQLTDHKIINKPKIIIGVSIRLYDCTDTPGVIHIADYIFFLKR